MSKQQQRGQVATANGYNQTVLHAPRARRKLQR